MPDNRKPPPLKSSEEETDGDPVIAAMICTHAVVFLIGLAVGYLILR